MRAGWTSKAKTSYFKGKIAAKANFLPFLPTFTIRLAAPMVHVSRHPEVFRSYSNLQFIQWLTYRGIVYGIDARYGSTHTGSLGD
jgi:hypothetical protein